MTKELQHNLELRGYESELALNIKDSKVGAAFLQQAGYVWNFSEATLKANVKAVEENSAVEVYPLTDEAQELKHILMKAFGDTED
ncbi:hypothetical protein JQK62_21170, partial [Leptospira santarosai]|nr:hypothetical protein [Leptospira santarosai]